MHRLVVTTDYLSGFQYENGVLQFFPHAEGYVKHKGNNQFIYAYQYKDHLGNVRLSYADINGNGTIEPATEILEENNYYPFGLKHKGYNEIANTNRSEAAERYKFNGMEWQPELGLDLYDFGARNYDAAIGRWLNVDPLAEKYRNIGGYVYCINNPINIIDPDGRDIIVLSHGPRSKTSIDRGKTNAASHFVGHMAVLIGNDKTGWTYLSYDYDKVTNKGRGKSGDNDVYTIHKFDKLSDFRNSEH